MTRTLRAVVIGANKVGVAGYAEVPAALDAALTMQEFLAARAPSGSDIRVLTSTGSTPATCANVDAAILATASTLHAEDLFVLMFSGHGNSVSSGQSWQLDDGVLTDFQLADYINGFPVLAEVVVIDDCCYGAHMFRPGKDKQLFLLRRQAFLQMWRRHIAFLLENVAQAASFILASSASSSLVHVDNTSEFVRTLVEAVPTCNANPPLDHYEDVIDVMTWIVGTITEQAQWEIQGRSPDGSDAWKETSPLRTPAV